MDLLALAGERPVRTLAAGEVLITQGARGGDLFILESGRLVVERDGVKIATVTAPGALLGEMAVLLDQQTTATVRAESRTDVRVVKNAREELESNPSLTFLVAKLMATRLDSTSAFLVKLSKEHKGKAEQGLLSSILSALYLPAGGDFTLVNREDLFG
jgi:CRP-like cAMP-binding protein